MATLLNTNSQRSREEMEYELLDTGVFKETDTSMFSLNMPKAVRKTYW